MRDEAIDVLERARAGIRRHQVAAFALATVGSDLAVDAARKGRRDEAIDELRELLSVFMNGGSRIFVGFPGEALVELLIERGRPKDVDEAHRIIDQWDGHRRSRISALDLWWLKSRALLARAEGDSEGYVELARDYLSCCEALDALGRLAEARGMVNLSDRRKD